MPGLPGSPVVKTLPSNTGGPSLNPGCGADSTCLMAKKNQKKKKNPEAIMQQIQQRL